MRKFRFWVTAYIMAAAVFSCTTAGARLLSARYDAASDMIIVKGNTNGRASVTVLPGALDRFDTFAAPAAFDTVSASGDWQYSFGLPDSCGSGKYTVFVSDKESINEYCVFDYTAGKSVITDMIASADFNEVTQDLLNKQYNMDRQRYNAAGFFTVGNGYIHVSTRFSSVSNMYIYTKLKGAAYVVEGAGGTGDSALEFRYDKASNADYATILFDNMDKWLTSDRYVFEMDTKINAAGNAVQLEKMFGEQNFFELFGEDGCIAGSKVKYVPDEWKTLKIEINHNDNTGYIYYDGRFACSREILHKPAEIKLELQNPAGGLKFAVDNVKLYDIREGAAPRVPVIKISGNTAEFTIFSDGSKPATLIIAGYDEGGALESMDLKTVTLASGRNTDTLSLNGECAEVRAFCWNSPAGMKPVGTD